MAAAAALGYMIAEVAAAAIYPRAAAILTEGK
jgi:predicted ATPase